MTPHEGDWIGDRDSLFYANICDFGLMLLPAEYLHVEDWDTGVNNGIDRVDSVEDVEDYVEDLAENDSKALFPGLTQINALILLILDIDTRILKSYLST